ncbi:hypothetical protein AaE_002939, partial [Aphanomyces astaci]
RWYAIYAIYKTTLLETIDDRDHKHRQSTTIVARVGGCSLKGQASSDVDGLSKDDSTRHRRAGRSTCIEEATTSSVKCAEKSSHNSRTFLVARSGRAAKWYFKNSIDIFAFHHAVGLP